MYDNNRGFAYLCEISFLLISQLPDNLPLLIATSFVSCD